MFAKSICSTLMLGLSTAAVAQSVDVPSGRDVALYDVILEEDPAIARFRFLVPAMGQTDAVTFSDVVDDIQFLCDQLALPGLAANGWTAKDVVISLSAAEVPFGELTSEVTQFFQPFSISDNSCVWEDF